MIICEYLQFDHDDKVYVKFSDLFPNFTSYMGVYSKRTDLKYHIDFSDFVIREFQPSTLDIVICIWILGKIHYF